MWVISFKIINQHYLKLRQKACIMVAVIQNKNQGIMLKATIWSQVIQSRDVTCNILYSSSSFVFCPVSTTAHCQLIVNCSLAIQECLINQSLFVFFLSGCNGCQCCSICIVPLTVIKFLIIFMFVEFMINKFLHSCSVRTRFTPMHHAFVAFRVTSDLLSQVFVCQVSFHCIDWQHNLLMSATNTE